MAQSMVEQHRGCCSSTRLAAMVGCSPGTGTLRVVESRSGRTSFKVLDGSAQGQTLSLSDANAAEYLGPKAPASTPATVTITYGKYVIGWVSEARNGEQLNQQMATLEVAGLSVQVAMNSVWGSDFTPLPAGTYSVLLPDAPHKKEMTRFYRNVEPSSAVRSGLVSYQARRQQPLRSCRQPLRRLRHGLGSQAMG